MKIIEIKIKILNHVATVRVLKFKKVLKKNMNF